jgi:hypothetical protein
MAREKECDRACRQPARRGFPPRLWLRHRVFVTSARATLPSARNAHVAPPKPAAQADAGTRLRGPRAARAPVSRLGTNRCESLSACRRGLAEAWADIVSRGCTFPPRRGRCAGGAHTRAPALAQAARTSPRAASRHAAPRLPPTPAAWLVGAAAHAAAAPHIAGVTQSLGLLPREIATGACREPRAACRRAARWRAQRAFTHESHSPALVRSATLAAPRALASLARGRCAQLRPRHRPCRPAAAVALRGWRLRPPAAEPNCAPHGPPRHRGAQFGSAAHRRRRGLPPARGRAAAM